MLTRPGRIRTQGRQLRKIKGQHWCRIHEQQPVTADRRWRDLAFGSQRLPQERVKLGAVHCQAPHLGEGRPDWLRGAYIN
jgi:hypothetical protein